jgi:hypothetical protein
MARERVRSGPAGITPAVDQERMMLFESLNRQRAVGPRERMNSPLEIRKVRLRGLGGPTVCGVSSTWASATGESAGVVRSE